MKGLIRVSCQDFCGNACSGHLNIRKASLPSPLSLTSPRPHDRACTPSVSNTPGLSIHPPASNGAIDASGKSTCNGADKLDMDTYIISAHIRFFVANADDTLPKTTYDPAA